LNAKIISIDFIDWDELKEILKIFKYYTITEQSDRNVELPKHAPLEMKM
jgi:hypothetical protein